MRTKLRQQLLNGLLVLSGAACPLLSAQATFDDIFPTPPEVCDRTNIAYGPLQVLVLYSDKYGLVFDPKYINNIGQHNAISLEFAFGGEEFRGAFTWGHALSADSFFKVSAEYLAQEAGYDFVTGPDNEWVGQGAFGVDFKQLIHGLKGIHSYHINVQYINSENIGLDNREIVDGGGTNRRNISGARDFGAIAGIQVTPWMDALFDLDVHWDHLEFRRRFANKHSTSSGFGGTAAYHQLIGGHWKVDASATDRHPYYEYSAAVSHLLNTRPGTRCELQASWSLSGGELPERDSRWGLGIFYTWGGNQYTSARNDYRADVGRGITRDVIDYTNVPAVRPPQVLAKEEQVIIP